MTKVSGCLRLVLGLLATQALAGDFRISSYDRQGNVTWTNAFFSGVCTIEAAATLPADSLNSQWRVQQNYFTTNSTGQGALVPNSSNRFFRLVAVDVSTNTPLGYANLVASYGLLRTVAGNGYGAVDGSNYWQASFEGGYATNAALSRPHYAMADGVGNVFIVDKNSHSVLKVTPDGRIHSVAGTHTAGDGPDYSTNATQVQLSAPNGIWVRGDGAVYVLDTGNNKIRRLDTNGMMETLFTVTSEVISQGRGIWVKDDESLAYFASERELKKWTPTSGVKTLNNNFTELGNFVVNPDGDIITTDRGKNKVYVIDPTGGNAGNRNILFGDGNTNPVIEGTLALTNSLYGVRGVWLMPTGGYLLGTHEGSQVLYVDLAGIVHVFVDGTAGAHSGDGQWFHSPGDKISEVRSVSLDNKGNILITENDSGFIRRIDFLRLSP